MHRWETGRSLWLWSTDFANRISVSMLMSSVATQRIYSSLSVQRRIIQRLWWFGSWEENSLRSLCLIFTSKKLLHQWTDRSEGHVQKSLQECLYIKHSGICWLLVSYAISFFSYEDFRKHKRTLMILNQLMKKVSKWNTPLIVGTVQL